MGTPGLDFETGDGQVRRNRSSAGSPRMDASSNSTICNAGMVIRGRARRSWARLIVGIDHVIRVLATEEPGSFKETSKCVDGDLLALRRHHIFLEFDAAQAAERAPVQVHAAIVIYPYCGVDVLYLVGLGYRLRDDRPTRMRIFPGAQHAVGNGDADNERIGMFALSFLHGGVEVEAFVCALHDLSGIGVARL